MSLKQLLIEKIEAENNKRAGLLCKAEKENPLALKRFQEEVRSTLESKITASKSFPNFLSPSVLKNSEGS